eukprot:SAG31_NODE_25972_length_450_cov_8.994302_1_plen_58_part_10
MPRWKRAAGMHRPHKTSMFGVWVRPVRSWSEIEGRKDLDMVRNAFLDSPHFYYDNYKI